MNLRKLRYYLRHIKRNFVTISANIGRGVAGDESVWAIWNDDIFASGESINEAAKVFLYRYLHQISSPFPENLPPIMGTVTFVVKDTGTVLVDVRFFDDAVGEPRQ